MMPKFSIVSAKRTVSILVGLMMESRSVDSLFGRHVVVVQNNATVITLNKK